MDYRLDIVNNPNAVFENDCCIVYLNDNIILWKAGMFNPKMRNNILYWLGIRNK
jgi:hypothetical protein